MKILALGSGFNITSVDQADPQPHQLRLGVHPDCRPDLYRQGQRQLRDRRQRATCTGRQHDPRLDQLRAGRRGERCRRYCGVCCHAACSWTRLRRPVRRYAQPDLPALWPGLGSGGASQRHHQHRGNRGRPGDPPARRRRGCHCDGAGDDQYDLGHERYGSRRTLRSTTAACHRAADQLYRRRRRHALRDRPARQRHPPGACRRQQHAGGRPPAHRPDPCGTRPRSAAAVTQRPGPRRLIAHHPHRQHKRDRHACHYDDRCHRHGRHHDYPHHHIDRCLSTGSSLLPSPTPRASASATVTATAGTQPVQRPVLGRVRTQWRKATPSSPSPWPTISTGRNCSHSTTCSQIPSSRSARRFACGRAQAAQLYPFTTAAGFVTGGRFVYTPVSNCIEMFLA